MELIRLSSDAFSGHCGAVTAFELSKEHFLRYTVQIVGGDIHQELWVPAEDLTEFNSHIVGDIRVTNAYFGDGFVIPENEEMAAVLDKFKNNGNESTK